jgi:hypothetical protein
MHAEIRIIVAKRFTWQGVPSGISHRKPLFLHAKMAAGGRAG